MGVKNNIINGIISIVSAKIAIVILGFITTPIIVRFLGSSSYGDYAAIMSIYSVLLLFVTSGTYDGIRKHIAESGHMPHWQEYVLSFYIRVGSVILLFVAITFVLADLVTEVHSVIGSSEFLGYILLMLGTQFGFSTARSVLMGLSLEHISESLLFIKKILFSLFTILFLYFGFKVEGVLFSHVFSGLVVTLLGLYILSGKVELGYVLRKIPSEVPRRQLLRFNINNIILVFLIYSLYHSDILLIQLLTDSKSTGYYRAALDVAEFLWFIPMAIQMVLIQSTSSIWEKDDLEKINTIAQNATKYNIFLSLTISAGLFALAHTFIPLYFGQEFVPAIDPLLYLLPGVVGFAFARPLIAIGQGKGNLQLLIVATLIASIINLLLNLILIPRHGIIGASIATSIGYASMLVFHYLSAKKMGYSPFTELPIIKLIYIIPSVFIVIFIYEKMIPIPLLSLLIVPPLGFISSLLIFVATGFLSFEEIKENIINYIQ